MTEQYEGVLTIEQRQRIEALNVANQVMRSSGLFNSTQPKNADDLIDLADWILDGNGEEDDLPPGAQIDDPLLRMITGLGAQNVTRLRDGVYVGEIRVPRDKKREQEAIDGIKKDVHEFVNDDNITLADLKHAEAALRNTSCKDPECMSCRASVEMADVVAERIKAKMEAGSHEDPVDFDHPSTGMAEPSDSQGGETDNADGEWKDAGTTATGFSGPSPFVGDSSDEAPLPVGEWKRTGDDDTDH